MGDGAEPEPPGARGQALGAGRQPWRATLDRAMPWLMAGWAVAQILLVLLLADPLRLDEGDRFAPAVFLLATVSALLVVAALVLAAGNAKATRDVPRVAWLVVAGVLALVVPMLVALLSMPEPDRARECPRWGFVPYPLADALLGWIPWLAYLKLGLPVAFVGLGLLFAKPTWRQGAWVLAVTAMALTLWLAAFGLMVDSCPEE